MMLLAQPTMTFSEPTSWHLIQGAAAGNAADRETFARRYGSAIRAYLAARWRTRTDAPEVQDAAQDVFVQCFRPGGALDRVEAGRGGGFHAFLYGVVRHVALKAEAQRERHEQALPSSLDPHLEAASEESLSAAFDREWARSMMKEAAALLADRARLAGEAVMRRVEILRLRFQEDLPIRDIAERWSLDPAFLHHEYAQARKEFGRALREVIACHGAGGDEDVERTLQGMLAVLL